MKVVVFVSHRYIDNYDFSLLLTEVDYLVACVLEPFVGQFPKSKKQYFNEIIPVSIAPDNVGPLIKFDYEILKKKTKELITRFECSDDFWLICVDEVNMSLSARLRDELNLPGVKEKEALLFQNKVLMKDCLRNSKILIPKYQLFDIDEAKSNLNLYFNKLKNNLGNKFVLKPSSYTGSFGVQIVKDVGDFRSFCSSKCFELHEYEAESYIDGDLYHCDVAMSDGEILFLECCKYSCPNNDFSNGMIIASLILPQESEIRSQISKIAVESITCLGATKGVFHVELFVTKNEIYFLEVAARPAGGLVAKMYEKMFGINLFTLDLGIHLGVALPEIKRNNFFCLQALIPINKYLINCFNSVTFKSHIDIEWLISKDEITKRSSQSVVDVAGRAIFISNKYEDIEDDFYALKTLGADNV